MSGDHRGRRRVLLGIASCASVALAGCGLAGEAGSGDPSPSETTTPTGAGRTTPARTTADRSSTTTRPTTESTTERTTTTTTTLASKPADPDAALDVVGAELVSDRFDTSLLYEVRNPTRFTWDPLWHVVDFFDDDGERLMTATKTTVLPAGARDMVEIFYDAEQAGGTPHTAVADGEAGYQIDLAAEELSRARPAESR
ncbi:MAG: hypothetical protein ABEJ08_02350 [Halobacteriaceae archaeon]